LSCGNGSRCCAGSCINQTVSTVACGACGNSCAATRACQPVSWPIPGLDASIPYGRCTCATNSDCGTRGSTCVGGVCQCTSNAQCNSGHPCLMLSPDAGFCR
jgi:hypothetical protein